jgi:hypothetical protein
LLYWYKSTSTDAAGAQGWVYMTRDTGGYVVTVGADDGKIQNAEYSGPPPDFSYCGNFQSPSPQICRAAALMIRVNMTHVIVGHEIVNADGTGRTVCVLILLLLLLLSLSYYYYYYYYYYYLQVETAVEICSTASPLRC